MEERIGVLMRLEPADEVVTSCGSSTLSSSALYYLYSLPRSVKWATLFKAAKKYKNNMTLRTNSRVATLSRWK